MKSISLILIFGFSLPAVAARKIPDTFCIDGEKLSKHVKSCTQNDVYVNAAENCLARLEKLVDTESKVLDALLKGPKGENQNKNLTTANKDYKTAISSLDFLLSEADRAADEVDDYQDYKILPEDYDAPDIADPDAYLENFDCYADTRDSIDSVLEDVAEIKEELEEAKAIALANATAAGVNATNLDSTQKGVKAAAPTKGKAPVSAAKKKGAAGSDITGTEENKKKAQGK